MFNLIHFFAGNNFNCDCQLIWLLTLRNETKSEPLKLALSTVTCTFDKNEQNQLKQEDDDVKDKVENVFELGTGGEIFQQTDDDVYADNPLYKLDTTDKPVTNEVALVDVPVESLLCPGEKLHKGEDSLMLSSKDETYWQSNSSLKSSVTSVPLIILLLASYIYH